MIAAHRIVALRFRRDLECQRVQMGSHSVWVLKDPLSRELQYVSDDEYTILQLADGVRSVQEVLNECTRRFATQFLFAEGMVHFLADAKRRHLLVDFASHETVLLDDKLNSPQVCKPWWMQLLAIRFPGIRPDRFLDWVFPYLRPLFTTGALVSYFFLVLVASVIVIVNWDSITTHVSMAFLHRGTHTLVQLMVVVAVVKIFHELAHAIACKACGGDCRELGVMLLLGVPCLYCDVSDAWTMPQRSKRILISAAGIIAEIGIAAVATLLWLWTGDTQLREWWLVVMVVCSVNTLIVNGNPLMRYDGYFILSDSVGIPNLAAKSATALRQYGRRLLWNEPIRTLHERDDRQRLWLSAYAMLSGIYRTLVLAAFAAVVYRFTFGNGLAVIGIVLACLLAGTTLWPGVHALLTPPNRLFGSKQQSSLSVAPYLVVFVFFIALLIPLPQSIVAPMTIRPANSRDVYVTVGGRLIESKPEGVLVSVSIQNTDSIATLENAELRGELLAAESRYESLVTQGKSFVSRRSAEPENSAAMLASTAAEQAALERLTLLRSEVDKLKLVAPNNGIIFSPANKTSTATRQNDRESWTGTPLDSANIGAWLEPGTLVCSVGDATRREALLMVDQKNAAQVEVGQHVRLQLATGHAAAWQGTVIEVGMTPVLECPSELLASGLIATDDRNDPNRSSVPRDTLYQIRVELNESGQPLPIRSIGSARIYVAAESLSLRIRRLFLQSFRI